MELHSDPVIPLLRLYPKNPETPIQNNLCSPMFPEVLFTTVKCWKQPKCPLVNEWIKKTDTFTLCDTVQQKNGERFL